MIDENHERSLRKLVYANLRVLDQLPLIQDIGPFLDTLGQFYVRKVFFKAVFYQLVQFSCTDWTSLS